MLVRCITVGILSLVLTSALIADSAPATNWTVDQWKKWRDTQISHILEPTFASNSEKLLSRDEVITRSAAAFAAVEPFMISDPTFFAPTTERGKAMANFVSFIRAQHWMALKDANGRPTNALGMEIKDTDYVTFAEATATFPPLLKSQDFLQKMSNPSTYKDAVAMIDAANASRPEKQRWITLPFRAQFIQSVDRTTYARLLVLIPNDPAPDGGTIDKWVLFAMATPDMSPTTDIKSVSVFAAHRHPNQQQVTTTTCIDFMRVKDVNGHITPTPVIRLPFDPTHTSKNCYDCHKAAVMPIHPDVEFKFDANGKLIEKSGADLQVSPSINDLIESYGPPDFAKQDVKAYGPSIGPKDHDRSDAFIAAASAGTGITAESYPRIRRAMRCSNCHDDFAPINYSQAARTNRDVQAFKGGHSIIETFIMKGMMPPDNSLTNAERKALWQCLSLEYLDLNTTTGIFVDWLKGGATSATDSAPNDLLYQNLAGLTALDVSQSSDALRQTYESRKKIFGPTDQRTSAARTALARSLAKSNRSDEVVKLLDEIDQSSTDSEKVKVGTFRAADPTTRPAEHDLPVHGF